MNKLRDKKQESGLPTARSDAELASKFLTYFKDKIKIIRDSFAAGSEFVAPESVGGTLNVFVPVTADELRVIISRYSLHSSITFL